MNHQVNHLWRRWAGLVLGVLLAVGLGIGSSGGRSPQFASKTLAAQAAPMTELRGVWLTNIDSDVLFSTQKLKQGLERLARLNFNTIYPTVWNWGYTLYPSTIAQAVIGRALDPEPGLRGRDMMAEAVREGHRLGMAVIPWFEFGFMAPADSNLARRRPEWITQRRDGSQVVMEGTHPRVWLNPFHPQVQQFIQALVVEIVAKYEVDGIQFDDHFGLPSELGYDPYTVARYRREHNGQAPPQDFNDPQWLKWRAEIISNFTEQLFHAVKAIRPGCVVAVAPNPQEFSYRRFLQDWHTWEQRGLVEELIVQLYRRDMDQFQRDMADPAVVAARDRIPVGVGILTGLKNRPEPIAKVHDYVKAVRQAGLAGVSFFFYESLGDRDADLAKMFAQPAKRPMLPKSL